jgi:hypothetical protein
MDVAWYGATVAKRCRAVPGCDTVSHAAHTREGNRAVYTMGCTSRAARLSQTRCGWATRSGSKDSNLQKVCTLTVGLEVRARPQVRCPSSQLPSARWTPTGDRRRVRRRAKGVDWQWVWRRGSACACDECAAPSPAHTHLRGSLGNGARRSAPRAAPRWSRAVPSGATPCTPVRRTRLLPHTAAPPRPSAPLLVCAPLRGH